MTADPYTIRIFVPDGDPEGVRIIDRFNWTGKGIVFPRSRWAEVRKRKEMDSAGVYILVGDGLDEGDLQVVYVGEGDGIRDRIDQHDKEKVFWSFGVAFVSASKSLNKAHVQWLEFALLAQATRARRCTLVNATSPTAPELTESETADIRGFLKEILQILPLVGLRVFEVPVPVAVPATAPALVGGGTRPDAKAAAGELDTVIVPANKEGFEKVFLGEKCWYAIRISGGALTKLKWIGAYQTAPVSAVTHYAAVAAIEPYGDGSKYKLLFTEAAKALPSPIPFGDATTGSMQGPRYTTIAKLLAARKVTDLF